MRDDFVLWFAAESADRWILGTSPRMTVGERVTDATDRITRLTAALKRIEG
jgi:hypothetical protein